MAEMVMDKIVLNEKVILSSTITEQGFTICISSEDGKDLGVITMDPMETRILFQLDHDPMQ